MTDNTRPVGIFDSGLGGLCAVRETLRILPDENIVYFGDSGRVPYGGRSYDTIKKYARQDINFLLSKNVKIILVACGTVASVATDYLKEIYRDINMPIIGVVEAACEKAVAAARASGNKNIGVTGTVATISNGMYERYIKELDPECRVYSRACPLFVPLVENGHTEDGDMITKLAAEKYLSDFKELGLSSLILGCTHYPMIKNIIGGVMGDKTELIDAGREAAYRLKRELTERGMLNGKHAGDSVPPDVPPLDIYISDETLNFSRIASGFLGFDIKSGVTKIDIEKY